MKKIITLLTILVMLVSLAACNSEKLTMKELVEANQTETLLEAYDSVSVQTKANGEMYIEYYLTEEFSYEKIGNWSMFLTDETGYVYEDDMYKQIVRIDRNGLVSHEGYRVDQYGNVVISQDSVLEKIESVVEAEEHITVVSSMDEKTLFKVVGDENLKSYDVEYIMDAADYRLMNATAKFGYGDGSVVFDLECSYNQEMPEEIQAYLAYKNQAEDLRSVTLVFQAGTPDENVEYLQVPKGMPVSIVLTEGTDENYSFYSDAACTQRHVDTGDYTSDVTVYVKWNP